MATEQLREPEIFTAGDTLTFWKDLPDFLPGDGWSLHYTITDLYGVQVASLTSTPDGSRHKIYQDNLLPDALAADYILSGFAVNGAERRQIYKQVLTIESNLGDSTDDPPQMTEAQEMISLLRESLKQLYRQQFQETDVQRNKFVMQKQAEVRQELAYWKEVRQNEIQLERARAGLPPGNVVMPVFNIG